jgi:flagellar protein FliT
MLHQAEIVALYEAMSAITGAMLVAARAGEWDALAALVESRCAAHVQTLREQGQESQQPLPGTERAQKIKIIQKILADDLEIRTLTKVQMAQLSTLMNSANTERKLSEAYG